MTLSDLLSSFPANFAQVIPVTHGGIGAVAASPTGSVPNLTRSLYASDVRSVVFDSRQVQPGSLYVAIRGEKVDGHAFLNEVVKKGALALIVQEHPGLEQDLARIEAGFRGVTVQVANTREALAILAAAFYAHPSRQLFTVGVTGTNGKTTTTYLNEALLGAFGWPTGVTGTINHHLGAKVWPSEMTTPDPVAFQNRLREFHDQGAKAVTLEVSSHALDQHRVDAVDFDVAQFTNLSRDHLDYHFTMEAYFEAKQRFFTGLLRDSKKPNRFAVINGDDEYGRRIPAVEGVTRWYYGTSADCDLRFQTLEQGFAGTRFELRTPFGHQEFVVPMPGLHNVYNATAAVGAALAAGMKLEAAALALRRLRGVPGRLESVPNSKGVYIFVDYAHTDDALRTVLSCLNGIRRAGGLGNKIITVFGCGGDRDKGKRPLMMQAAAQSSDLVVLTSDNPRTEDPMQILRDAAAGADASTVGRTLFLEVDRRLALKKACELAQTGDVIVVAGKGHEDYQIIGATRHSFSDAEVLKEILK